VADRFASAPKIFDLAIILVRLSSIMQAVLPAVITSVIKSKINVDITANYFKGGLAVRTSVIWIFQCIFCNQRCNDSCVLHFPPMQYSVSLSRDMK
jgi:hypothetical protein